MSDLVERSEMLEALADQRRRMGAENDSLTAELKEVRRVAITEIDRISKQSEREIEDWQTERNCARQDHEAAEALLKEAGQALREFFAVLRSDSSFVRDAYELHINKDAYAKARGVYDRLLRGDVGGSTKP